MRKFFMCLLALLIAVTAAALDLGNGFGVGGGVKTGILIKNSDFTGKLGGLAHADKYPMTLYFASQDSESYKGEGWLSFGYNAQDWGLNFSFWAHGDLKNYSDLVHLGDYYLWASLFSERLRFIGGQGGGTPISTQGWVNADWLSYTGLRLFWVDPLGFSVGINFPDPDDGAKAEGIKPVTYLSMIMFGGAYRYRNFFVSVVFDNNPIYDDTNANYDGGLHRDPTVEPIAQSGNIGFGIGLLDMFDGRGNFIFDGIVANLGEDDVVSTGSSSYKISPIKTTLALKASYLITSSIFAELKAKYLISQGDNAERTASVTWGKFEIEPYGSYQIMRNLKFELAFNYAAYINSYYLSAAVTPNATIGRLEPGQVAAYPSALDYLSPFQLSVKPALIFSYSGALVTFGYNCIYSRDHIENTLYLDFRWAF